VGLNVPLHMDLREVSDKQQQQQQKQQQFKEIYEKQSKKANNFSTQRRPFWKCKRDAVEKKNNSDLLHIF
jgi:hypothetical protein